MSRSSRFARPFSGALAASLMILAVGAPAHATWPLKLGPNGEYPTVDDAKNPANWPNDPNWGYLAADKPKDRRKGQWEYFGFQPDRSLNAPPLRAAEVGKACGGSMDLAWSVTIGDPFQAPIPVAATPRPGRRRCGRCRCRH